jgi:hypothetical protein
MENGRLRGCAFIVGMDGKMTGGLMLHTDCGEQYFQVDRRTLLYLSAKLQEFAADLGDDYDETAH